ncbi:MAG: peptidylprolyl isomerase [Ruthenibacterium sp.]
MKKFLKRLSVMLVVVLCLGVLASCGKKPASETTSESTVADSASAAPAKEAHEPGLFVDGKKVDADPIMTVDGKDISFDVYRYYYLTMRDRVSGGDATLWTGDEAAEATVALKDYVRQNMLSLSAFDKLAADKKITLTEAEIKNIEDGLASVKEQMGGPEAFAKALESQYYTEQTYHDLTMESVLHSKVLTEVYGDDIRADVAKNYVHAQHILVKFPEAPAAVSGSASTSVAPVDHSAALAKAKEIKAKIDAGEDFSALMEQYNEDTGESPDGYHFTTGEMVPEFEKATFALAENEVSDIVETTYGYHIIRRLPIDSTYVDQKLTALMSDDIVKKVDADLNAIAAGLTVTFSDAYEKVAPDTMF